MAEKAKGKPPEKKPKPKSASRLGSVSKGKQVGANRLCFYGPEAVGKTTLAAHAPNPIFIDIEDGSKELDVARYVFEGGDAVPSSFDQVMEALRDILMNEHDYETLVIDSIDRLQSLIWKHCIDRDTGKASMLNQKAKKLVSIESYGFGKGYVVANDELRKLLSALDVIRKRRNMHIIFVGHVLVKLFKDPASEDYDRYQIRAHESFGGQIKEWVDVLGFCSFQGGGGSAFEGGKSKGWASGDRIIQFERGAAFDAKSRIPLPPEVVMGLDDPWAPFARAIKLGQSKDPKEVLALIKAELKRIEDDELTSTVNKMCKTYAKDAQTLARFLIKLQGKKAATPEDEESDKENE